MAQTGVGPLTGARARVIVDAVVRLLAELAAEPGESFHVTYFDSVITPEEPLVAYAARIFDHMRCSAECFPLALIYINRYLEAAEERLSATNVHRLLVTSVRLATKFFDDEHRSNRTCAALGGIRTSELNELESRFLKIVGWSVYVSQEECEECMEALWLANTPRLAHVVSCGSPTRRRAVAAVESSPPSTPPKEVMRAARHRLSSSSTAGVPVKKTIAKVGSSACIARIERTPQVRRAVTRLAFRRSVVASQHMQHFALPCL